MLGAITAWLKKYYPPIFMAETMNIFSDNSDKLRMYLHVTNDMGIEILSPNLNSSNKEFSSNGKDVLFGLGALAYMGKNSETILNERKARNEFKSFEDFINRMVKYQKTNKRAFEALIYSGALDSFEGNRKTKIDFLPKIIESRKKEKNTNSLEQISMGDLTGIIAKQYNESTFMPEKEEFEKRYMLEKEKEFAGFYVTEHPLDEIMPHLDENNITNISDLMEETEEDDEVMEEMIVDSLDGRQVDVVGILSDVKTFYTKKTGDPLKVFQIEDKGGVIKGVMFSDKIDKYGTEIFEGNIVILSGVVKEDDFGRQIIVNQVKDIESMKKAKTNYCLYLKAINDNQLKELNKRILNQEKYAGNGEVIVSYKGKVFKSDKKINLSITDIENIVRNIFYDNNYKIKKKAM